MPGPSEASSPLLKTSLRSVSGIIISLYRWRDRGSEQFSALPESYTVNGRAGMWKLRCPTPRACALSAIAPCLLPPSYFCSRPTPPHPHSSLLSGFAVFKSTLTVVRESAGVDESFRSSGKVLCVK